MARTIVALMLLAMAACSESFTPMPRGTHFNPSLFVSVLEHDITAEAPMMTENLEQHVGLEEKPKVATKRKPVPKKDAEHKHGPLSPLVVLMKQVMGEDELNRLRGKVIGLHSDVIGKFVETAETPFGEQVLRVFFVCRFCAQISSLRQLFCAAHVIHLILTRSYVTGFFSFVRSEGHFTLNTW